MTVDLPDPPWSRLLVSCFLDLVKWTCHTRFHKGLTTCYQSSAIGSPDPAPCQHNLCPTSRLPVWNGYFLQSSHFDTHGMFTARSLSGYWQLLRFGRTGPEPVSCGQHCTLRAGIIRVQFTFISSHLGNQHLENQGRLSILWQRGMGNAEDIYIYDQI